MRAAGEAGLAGSSPSTTSHPTTIRDMAPAVNGAAPSTANKSSKSGKSPTHSGKRDRQTDDPSCDQLRRAAQADQGKTQGKNNRNRTETSTRTASSRLTFSVGMRRRETYIFQRTQEVLEPKTEVEESEYVAEELQTLEGFEDILARFKLPTAEDEVSHTTLVSSVSIFRRPRKLTQPDRAG